MSVNADYYRDLLRTRFHGRRAIIAYGQLNMVGKDVALLRELGADDPFVLCEGTGTGTTEIDFSYRIIGMDRADDILTPLHHYDRVVSDLPPEVSSALDAYDRAGDALVIQPLWGTFHEVGGRPVYGARRRSWLALEDKVIIDALWERLGVQRAPYQIVPATLDALMGAHRSLDRGAGTVWAGDARDGWHGGAEGTHWVKGSEHAERAVSPLVASCDQVRVMPFLEGIPCSIHGIVGREHVIALRPVELVTLRDMHELRFRYFGCSSSWDPSPADREAMRELARRVGAALRDEVDYRGTFTIDGVMTAEGFLPTELNPRYGAGMYRLTAGLPELPMYMVNVALCADEDWDFRLPELEELLVSAADGHRVPTCNAWDRSLREVSETVEFATGPSGLRRAEGAADVVGTILAGPSPLGSFYKILFDLEFAGIGPSIGPRALEALEFCDRELGTNFGQLASAQSVR